MIDWALVDEEESAALAAYAQLFGMTPEEFAHSKLAAIRASQNTFNRAQIGIGGKGISLPIDENLGPVRGLIALGRRAAKDRTAKVSGLVCRHVEMYHPLYGIDFEALTQVRHQTGKT